MTTNITPETTNLERLPDGDFVDSDGMIVNADGSSVTGLVVTADGVVATATPRCQCESVHHFPVSDALADGLRDHEGAGTGHAYLAVPAGAHRADWVGEVCDECAATHMAAYLLPEADHSFVGYFDSNTGTTQCRHCSNGEH